MNTIHKPDAPFSPINYPKYQHTLIQHSVSVATEVPAPVAERKRKRKGSFSPVLRRHVLRAAEAVAGLPRQERKNLTTGKCFIKDQTTTDIPVGQDLEHDGQPTNEHYDRKKVDQSSSKDEAPVGSGELSAVTLRKLQAFRYVVDPGPTISRPRQEAERLPNNMKDVDIPNLDAYFSDDDPEVDEEDFELDQDVFADFIDQEGIVQSTPEMTDINQTAKCEVVDLITPSLPNPPSPAPTTRDPVDPIRSQRRVFEPSPSTSKIQPFMRSKFPELAPTSSLLPSLVPARRVTTCFRIAEVLRLLSTTNPGTMLRVELYARVVKSSRNTQTKIQDFTLADLFFPQRPPNLQAAYSLWTDSQLFDNDSGAFLGCAEEGKLCRAILQVVKGGRVETSSLIRSSQGGINQSSSPDIKILNIWEATWDDVQYVKGIVEP